MAVKVILSAEFIGHFVKPNPISRVDHVTRYMDPSLLLFEVVIIQIFEKSDIGYCY